MKTKVSLDNNTQVFFELVRAGLWEKEVRLAPYGEVDFSEILKLATEQSVVGLVAAGLEHVKDVKVPQEWTLQFVGSTLQIEQRNKAMNEFVEKLITLLRKNDVYALLLKGQGIAQCYEKPLWRASGDVDLLLSEENYQRAKQYLIPLARSVEAEESYTKHIGMFIEGWEVELHGNLRGGISSRCDKVLDGIWRDVFYAGNVRSWLNGKTQVFLISADNDVFYVFSHILHHFYFEGVGLRQVCDWCRLLFCYREKLDIRLLESRIRKAGLTTEWKTFGVLAIEYLGYPKDSMPLLNSSNVQEFKKFKRKADRVMELILESGNFGHNIDQSYRQKYSGFKKRAISVRHYTKEALQHFMIFPRNSVSAWCRLMKVGMRAAVRGE